MKCTTYDLVFLDIYMEHTTGIQIAGKIREYDPKCQIIFITTSEGHAVHAYRLHALDYLVKPYSYTDLKDALDHFEQKEFLLKNGERIPIATIRRQEIVQKYADYIFDHYSKGGILS